MELKYDLGNYNANMDRFQDSDTIQTMRVLYKFN